MTAKGAWLNREMRLTIPLTPAEQKEVVEYFRDILYTGHTLRDAIHAIETVWADMA